MLLTKKGYEIAVAASAEEASALMEKEFYPSVT